MTTEELHEILDDSDRKLSIDEIKEIIYELKSDVQNEWYWYASGGSREDRYKAGFYAGEQNAFYLVLDLLEHTESKVQIKQ